MNESEAREITVTASEARAEIQLHGLAWSDFVHDTGARDEYEGSEILDWLGY